MPDSCRAEEIAELREEVRQLREENATLALRIAAVESSQEGQRFRTAGDKTQVKVGETVFHNPPYVRGNYPGESGQSPE